MSRLIRIDASDNVATARVPLEIGQEGATELIPRGHKVAVTAIAEGEPILKYAQVIGYAARDIPLGAHVHTQNVAYRNVDRDYAFSTTLRPAAVAPIQDSFMGYARPNGRSGTRNHIAVLTSVNCSATAARRMAEHFTPER
ncbi:MAG: UxaA family hydrolase, partial [Pseudomonadota bacterium]